MRILILSHNLIERGNYFRALKFAHFLAAKGHDVTFMPSSNRWYKPKKYQAGKVKIIESPSWSFVIGIDDGWSPLGILYRIWTALKKKYDVVYGFSHKPIDFIAAYAAKILRGSFYISDWCDWWGKGGLFENIKHFRDMNPNLSPTRKWILEMYDRIEANLEEFVPRRADLVTVICQALNDRAVEIGIAPERLLKLVSGADTENVRPMDKDKAREEIGLSALLAGSNAAILGYTANYHLDESLLLETMSLVCRKKIDAKLLVVGAEFRTPDEQMKKWGLKIFDAESGEPMAKEHNIIHFGRRPFRDVPAYLAASDILLLPMTDIIYNRGRWPHKIGDYLAAGRPIVANDVGDIPILLRGRDAGLIAASDAQDFADKIIEMIQAKTRWAEFGANARKIAETELDWNTIGERLYQRISLI
ncbi:MAG TPA: glycosyltransferase [Candidatus Sumerlaeota bacterium]|nr:MAG: putative glycosyl transferase [candidate division BRC1 bacterium ADurb.Bin183]HOE63595.1 glycosyltransferase [Candidatus Sumerlaeota bacterium]HRR30725.1 glycosyltransferase [Candidatus Sumerlaeia bacterium]HON50491.1 glycosyltransferase [Candidatus Sumerlaeota bacterium]HOR63706.1 glycosyltransferase [Candidatus Sumerlaeota bacterium]